MVRVGSGCRLIVVVPGDRFPAVTERSCHDDNGAGAEVAGCDEGGDRLVPGSLPQPTLTAYTQDVKAYLCWCQEHEVRALRVSRGELEMYLRHLEGRGYWRRRSHGGSARWRPSTSTR